MPDKRPKDMSDEELRALPRGDSFAYWSGLRKIPPYGYAGDDLLGYWQDADGRWLRDTASPFD